MFASWRTLFLPALALGLGLACALPGGAAQAMDQADLEELERLLHELGFDPGKVDGVVDDDTIAAIRRYQEFAVLPGEPEPTERLLDELRGVAAAFAALNADKTEQAAAPAPSAPMPAPVPELGAGAPEPAEPAPAPDREPAQQAEAPPEKEIVPPPPAPPKLKPLDEAEAMKPQVAELPPADAEAPAAPEAETAVEAAPPAEPVDETQARIDAELKPYRQRLKDGSLTREALAKQFNDEGRNLLQQAQYDEAVVKFSVAIQLDPNFAGAYSNRGTAYQRQDEAELAKADFDKAKDLGFGGFRLRSAENPLR